MKVVLPFPNKKLMPNNKNGHSYRYSKLAKDKAKSDAYYATKSSNWRGVHNHLFIMFYMPDAIGRDCDNLIAALKPAIDGFAEALGVNDKHFRFKTDKSVDRANPRVEITPMSDETVSIIEAERIRESEGKK